VPAVGPQQAASADLCKGSLWCTPNISAISRREKRCKVIMLGRWRGAPLRVPYRSVVTVQSHLPCSHPMETCRAARLRRMECYRRGTATTCAAYTLYVIPRPTCPYSILPRIGLLTHPRFAVCWEQPLPRTQDLCSAALAAQERITLCSADRNPLSLNSPLPPAVRRANLDPDTLLYILRLIKSV